jgi:hypothetical protein
MNKIYIFVPLICLLVFSGFYMQFNKGYSENLVNIRLNAEKEKREKELKRQRDSEEANKIAIETAARRSKERAEKAKIEEDKKLAKVLAEEKKEQAKDERKQLREKVERLTAELKSVQEAVAKNEAVKTAHNQEIAFLQDMVKKTEGSQKEYYDLLEKIKAVEDAALKAAAEAAKKNS